MVFSIIILYFCNEKEWAFMLFEKGDLRVVSGQQGRFLSCKDKEL